MRLHASHVNEMIETFSGFVFFYGCHDECCFCDGVEPAVYNRRSGYWEVEYDSACHQCALKESLRNLDEHRRIEKMADELRHEDRCLEAT